MAHRTLVLVGLLALLSVGGPGTGRGDAQQTVAVMGRLLDSGTGTPIEGAVVELTELRLGGVTDETGVFRVAGVQPGTWELRVRHIAYGVHAERVEVRVGGDLALELRLSPRALELAPIAVEVLRPVRSESSRSNVITRAQIEAVSGRARHVGDLVRSYIPGAAVSEARGGYLCLEFRGARNSRTSGCNFPLVVLDGLPVSSPATFLRDLQLEDLERVEYVPASEGAVRYGMGATYGVLVIETRRSGIVAEARPPRAPTYPNYRWTNERRGHPSLRAFGGATLGVVAGTALGLAAIGCFPGAAGSGGACIEGAGAGTGMGALVLPLVGSAVGARLFGGTDRSRGRFWPNLAMTALPAALGYAVYVEGVKSDFDGERWLGGALVVVGTPVVSTLADLLFRKVR